LAFQLGSVPRLSTGRIRFVLEWSAPFTRSKSFRTRAAREPTLYSLPSKSRSKWRDVYKDENVPAREFVDRSKEAKAQKLLLRTGKLPWLFVYERSASTKHHPQVVPQRCYRSPPTPKFS